MAVMNMISESGATLKTTLWGSNAPINPATNVVVRFLKSTCESQTREHREAIPNK
jgi:hypothetical protein